MKNHHKSPKSPPSDRAWMSRCAALLRRVQLSLGYSIMFDGVCFFLNPHDRREVHAAIALRANDTDLIQRSTVDVQYVLRDFLQHYPELGKVVGGRIFVVRFVDSFEELDYEVAPRARIGLVDRFGVLC